MSLKRAHIYILLALSPALFFQNCGQDYNTSSLYGDGQSILDSRDCISEVVDCGAKTEFLLLSIDTPDPLVVSTATTSYTVSGRCNTGNYEEHYIRYEVRNSVGTLVASADRSGICISGRYQFSLPLTALANNESHTLLAFVVGVDTDSRSYSNNQSGGSDQIDFYKQ